MFARAINMWIAWKTHKKRPVIPHPSRVQSFLASTNFPFPLIYKFPTTSLPNTPFFSSREILRRRFWVSPLLPILVFQISVSLFFSQYKQSSVYIYNSLQSRFFYSPNSFLKLDLLPISCTDFKISPLFDSSWYEFEQLHGFFHHETLLSNPHHLQKVVFSRFPLLEIPHREGAEIGSRSAIGSLSSSNPGPRAPYRSESGEFRRSGLRLEPI